MLQKVRAYGVYALLPLVLLAIACALAFAPSVSHAAEAAQDESTSGAASSSDSGVEYQAIAELAGKRVGCLSGSITDQLILEYADGITDFSYFSTYADMASALKSGKVDAICMDNPVARLLASRNTGIALLPETLIDDDYGFPLSKNSPLTERLNPIIEGFEKDGTLDELIDKWCSSDEDAKTMPEQDWDTSAGTIRAAVCNASEPMEYLRDEELVGYEVEILLLCARELHMAVEVTPMPFDSLLTSVQSGKADLAAGCFSITDERKQSMDMTSPIYKGAVTFVVRSTDEVATGSFWEGLAASFERTFITEGRWKIFLSGLGVTLLISLSAGAFGVLLGFATMLLRRSKQPLFGRIVGVFEGLMSRLPIVVVLMVFYYILFGSSDIPGVVVAIIVFSLSFGATAGSIMWNSVRAVDAGQTEASLALGFNDNETFFGVVLPQAARNYLPLLQGQFVSLVKETAVVGYIAVVDLTRASDLIRSRTMEAFFPLFSTAAIYFAICCLLAECIGLISQKFDYVRKPRVIKGVELSDLG